MSVDIEPTELGFHRPFTQEVSQILKIKNPNHTPVAFKVKTTAPKQYCVRPNSGRIEPGKEVEVTVLLQAMKTEPAPDAKCRDKFLVQSVAVTPDKEFSNVNSIWQHVDDADRSLVQEKKIRVVFLSPSSEAGSGQLGTPLRATNNVSHDEPGLRSPSPVQAYTPDMRKASTPSVAASHIDETSTSRKNLGETRATGSNTLVDSASATMEDLKAKLAEAQATIASFGHEGGVRMRKIAAGETSSPTVNQVATKMQSNEGVPVQICAALCLISFLIAYLLF